MVERTNYLKFNFPHIAGCPITYVKGDEIVTKDGRKGVVVKYEFQDDLVLYDKDNIPSRGFFIITVDFGIYQSRFVRRDLSGTRLSGGFW